MAPSAAAAEEYRLSMAAQYTHRPDPWVRLRRVKNPLSWLLVGVLISLAGCVRYEDGRAAFNAGDYPRAFARWQLLAEYGNAQAQNELGWLYQQGLGVEPDPLQAVRWYRKAAAQGLAVAQTNLGIMYNDGLGVVRDRREAARWFELAARQGDAAALNNLGVLHDRGEGVPEDNHKAAEYLRKAADLGHPRAMSNLGLLYKNGEGVPQDAATAVRWFRAAADAGDREGLNNLAVMLDNGLGTPADPAAAQQLFERAARAGEAGAAVNLALMLMRPAKAVTVEQKISAYAWLNLAASQGYTEALAMRTNLALLLTPEQIATAQAQSLTLRGD